MTPTFRVVIATIAMATALALFGCSGKRMASTPLPPADSSPSFAAMSGEAQTWTDVEAVSLVVPAAEGGDGTLSYAATGLPEGVSFDPATRTLSGTPGVGTGTITITVTDTDADGEHDTDTYTIAWVVRPGPLVLGSGLHRSEATPAYADTATDTFERLVADDANSIPPLSAAITRDHDQSATTVSSSGWYVQSIASDGAGGFRVTYTDGDEVNTIHFDAANVVDEWGTLEATDEEGNNYWFMLSDSGYRYFDTAIGGGLLGDRFWFVLGARTPQAAVSEGSAVYSGRFRADSWSASDPSNRQRQRLRGDMRVVANFDLGTLAGNIRSIQGTEPGAPSSSRTSWPTSSFEITDGRIVDGQFTATITGHDSDSSVSLAESVAGFVGNLLGEMYGPGAEEIGAVFTATRDADGEDHDRVLSGYIGGQRSLGAYSDTEPLSAGVDRHDYSTSPRIVLQDANNRVTAIAADGEGGYTVNYLVDGESRSVSFEQDELGAIWPGAYSRRDGTAEHYFDPFGRQGYSYVNLGFWSYARYPDDGSSAPVFATAGRVAYGLRTAPDGMPTTGSATYTGDVSANS